MCLTICPRVGAHYFSLLQPRHFCKAPTSNCHQDFISCFLLKGIQRSESPKCARLSAPAGGPLFQLRATKAFLYSTNQ